MGYYINTEDINITIPKGKVDAAYKAVIALGDMPNEMKRGGSSTERWFSWMPGDLTTLLTFEDVFTSLGFEVEVKENGDIALGHYSSKLGQEDLFCDAIAPFVTDGSYCVWKGEDDTYWKWTYSDGKMLVTDGEVEVKWYNDAPYTVQQRYIEQHQSMDEYKMIRDSLNQIPGVISDAELV